MLKKYVLLIPILFGFFYISAQDSTSVKEKPAKDSLKSFKNTIRINLTNPLIFGTRFNVIGYERVIRDYQTASVSMGRFAFPKFTVIDNDSVQMHRDTKDKGFNFSVDYRFYLKKENKHMAPRGIYIGPYYTYNYFSRENNWNLNTSNMTGNLNTELVMNMHAVGFQLGFQFVIWKRLTLDMILVGPAVWFFDLKANVNTTLDPEDEALVFEKLNDALHEKFPASDVVIDGGEFRKKGTYRTNTLGYRYMFNLGFRF